MRWRARRTSRPLPSPRPRARPPRPPSPRQHPRRPPFPPALLRLVGIAQQGERSPGGLDLLARARGGSMNGDRERLRQLAAAEDLDVEPGVPDEANRDERLRRHFGAVVEALLEIADVDVVRPRPEG